MYTTIKGIYENGTLTLLEPVPGIEKSEVMVTFLDNEKSITTQKKGMKLGSLEGKFSLPDDFNEPLEDLSEYM